MAHFKDDVAVAKILSRAILIREIVELFTDGPTIEAVLEQVKAIPEDYYEPFRELSFRFIVDSYMRKISMEDQVTLINRFSFMPLMGQVSMKNAQVTFSIHCDDVAKWVYFGRLVGIGRRDLIDQFNLKKRGYLGTTSMDAELSLVMSNLACIGKGSLVYDPFVGTGSLLCTSSFFGALTLGSDIDGRQLRGTGEFSINSNMKQYDVEERFIDGCVFDILQHPWRDNFQVDAIITDPPYGVRAGAKKIGVKAGGERTSDKVGKTDEVGKIDRYPQTVPYEMEELAVDLHTFAVKFLRPGGRLVYWYPTEIAEDGTRCKEMTLRGMLPNIDGLKLCAIIYQRCRLLDRWLVIYEKIGGEGD